MSAVESRELYPLRNLTCFVMTTSLHIDEIMFPFWTLILDYILKSNLVVEVAKGRVYCKVKSQSNSAGRPVGIIVTDLL